MKNNTTISLGKPVTVPVLVPVEHKSTPTCINEPFMVNGKPYGVTAVSFGTPHGAVFVDDIDSVDVSSLGSALGTHPLFPKGASIVFVQVIDRDSLKARLWQRGEGEAEFSSEAVCAAAATAMMLQKIIKHETEVCMNGRTFNVQWNRTDENVYLTGAADLIQA